MIQPWTISIPDPNSPALSIWNGLLPAYYENSYPYFGNKNQFQAMTNIDILDPNVLTQGPAPAALTNGTQAAAVTTLIKGMTAYSSTYAYGVGGNKLYKFSATAVTSDATWPHTIDISADEQGDTVLYYQKASELLYFYNDGSFGYIGKYATGSFNDYWNEDALQNNVHPAIVGGDDNVYFGNGRYVGKYDGTTLTVDKLDTWSDGVVRALTWNNELLAFSLSRNNRGSCAIYFSDGIQDDFIGDPVEVNGIAYALWTKNGTTYVWWQEAGDTNRYIFGYISSGVLRPIKKMSGTYPLYYQVGEYKGYIAWLSDGLLYLYGSPEPAVIAPRVFQYTKAYYTGAGGLVTVGGALVTASYSTTNFRLDNYSGYTLDSNFKTRAFKTGAPGTLSFIDAIWVETEQLSTGAKLDMTLYYDKAKSNTALTQVAYSSANYTLHRILNKSVRMEDFQLYGSFANGSTTNPVKVRSILVQGHNVINS
jgi:hypothetical protein